MDEDVYKRFLEMKIHEDKKIYDPSDHNVLDMVSKLIEKSEEEDEDDRRVH